MRGLRHAVSSIGLKLCYFFLSVSLCQCLPDGDLCKWMNGRKYYIDVGESGIISVENATSLTKNEPSALGSQPQIPQRCSVELITCPSCHLEVGILHLSIPTCSADKTCRCDFVWIKESAYSKSGREYCGFKENSSLDLVYESKTKLVSIDFLYSGSYKDAFALQFSAKKNVYVYKGGYDYYQGNSSGVIRSPNFPGGYPSDYSAEFVLQNVDASGFVQLIFIDFQLSLWSFVEIFDSNGTRIDIYNGNTFRPPAIISSGPVLTVKFQANDEYPSSGFQAKYTFVSYPEKYWINRPSTDCGGFVEDFGGAITMMNMVPSNTLRAFDCIWLIRPRNSHIPDTQVAIRVAQFEEMGPKSTLTIRQGLHSDAPLLESVTTYQHHKMPRGQEYVVPATNGFYIRLAGYFTNRSHLAIIYTTFRYEGCYGVADFECENRRCVKNVLRCDGFNHCGDGSDEASCYGANQGTALPEDANWWRTLTPNYYFPKPDTSSGAGTNTLILVTSLAGLGMFVLTTVMILVKLHRQRHDDSVSREILHTVSGDIDMENSPSHHGGSDLPLYDPPPSYEDVVKLYMPPPPPYSSISRGRTRAHRSRPNGVENRAYRTDSPNAVHGQNRRPRATSHQTRIPPEESPHPLILKVSLPEEDTSSNNATSTRGRTCDMHVTHASNVKMPPENTATVPSEQNQTSASQTTAGPSGAAGSRDNRENSALGKLDSALKKQSKSSPSNRMEASQINKNDVCQASESNEMVKDREAILSCECQGACSCKLININKQVKRSSSETKVIICGSNNAVGTNKVLVTKKRSFKDMMQKGIKRAASSAIIPHPTLMTITVKPPKSKKSANTSENTISKSAGPSSPTTPYLTELENGKWVQDKKSQSLCGLGHRRTASGPIEISESLDSTHKSKSDEEVSKGAPHLAQMKHLTSVLLDGLQQSFNSQKDEMSPQTSKEGEKTVLPGNWSSSWISSHKRVDQVPKMENNLWVGSDTLPLLRNGSPQPFIVKFDDMVPNHVCNQQDKTLQSNGSEKSDFN